MHMRTLSVYLLKKFEKVVNELQSYKFCPLLERQFVSI